MRTGGPELVRRLRRRWTAIEVGATLAGAPVAYFFLHAFHAAEYSSHTGHNLVSGSVQLVAYLVIALALGQLWRERRSAPLWRLVAEERAFTPSERDMVLREPLRELIVPALLWGGAAVFFAAIELPESPKHAIEMSTTIALGGLTTCAVIYLLTERLMRPVTARALADAPSEHLVGPGVRARLITAWALASGIPMLGLALVAIAALDEVVDTTALAVSILIVAVGGLVAGAFVSVLSAHSLAEPIAAVRSALGRVHAGDFDVEVAVDDGSEIGLLQAGFNEMAAGLRERELLRDLFGRHVGEDVARRALDEGVSLGGEVREVAVLFVDLVGSTKLAAQRPAKEVLALLNRFFAVVVDVVEAHGGWVNKFEGDAALCVFGAPTEEADAAGRALTAGRRLGGCLRHELPELDAGIGISAGPAVAGNVGAERRLEYTVIGDPVNEASRLCELAKRRPERVIASGSAVSRASSAEAGRWSLGETTVLRGRLAPTVLARPVAADVHGTTDAKRGAYRVPTGT